MEIRFSDNEEKMVDKVAMKYFQLHTNSQTIIFKPNEKGTTDVWDRGGKIGEEPFKISDSIRTTLEEDGDRYYTLSWKIKAPNKEMQL